MKSVKIVAAIALMLAFTVMVQAVYAEPIIVEERPPAEIVGNDRDEHGCIASAGYLWCGELQQCVRPWEIECESIKAEIEHNASNGERNIIVPAPVKEGLDGENQENPAVEEFVPDYDSAELIGVHPVPIASRPVETGEATGGQQVIIAPAPAANPVQAFFQAINSFFSNLFG